MRDDAGREDFDALGQRIHPAASRVELLAAETPAVFVAFDLLAREDRSLLELPVLGAPRGARGSCSPRAVRRRSGRADGDRRAARGGAAMARARRGRDRQGALGALPAGRAQGHGQGQARAHDRRRRRRLAARQGGGHGRRADPRPLRRRRAARRRALLWSVGGREAAAASASWPTTRRASAAPPTPAAGAPARTSSGSGCARSSSSRSTSTTFPPGASVTAPSCAVGARTRPRASACSSSCADEPPTPIARSEPTARS